MIVISVFCVIMSMVSMSGSLGRDGESWKLSAVYLVGSATFGLLAAVCVSGLLERLAT